MTELIEMIKEKIRTRPSGALSSLDGMFLLLQEILKEQQEQTALLKEIKEILNNK